MFGTVVAFIGVCKFWLKNCKIRFFKPVAIPRAFLLDTKKGRTKRNSFSLFYRHNFGLNLLRTGLPAPLCVLRPRVPVSC